MRAEEFRIETFALGERHELELEFVAGGQRLGFPVLLLRGRSAGPVLAVSAGVHGDEYEGMRALVELASELDPDIMRGDLLAVPVLNVPAFEQGTRRSPLDGADLARQFPGRRDGSPSQALAWHFDQSILSQASFYVDLHSAGASLEMPLLVGYEAGDERSERAAFAFGAPVVWAHPRTPPGRSVSAAKACGIPFLYTEARGAGRIDAEDLAVFKRGLLNLMRHLGILPGAPEPAAPRLHLFGDGDIETSVRAGRDGFLLPEVELLSPVSAGACLGMLVDMWGRVLERYFAPRDGVVVLIHACPRVRAGEPVFLVTGLAVGPRSGDL